MNNPWPIFKTPSAAMCFRSVSARSTGVAVSRPSIQWPDWTAPKGDKFPTKRNVEGTAHQQAATGIQTTRQT